MKLRVIAKDANGNKMHLNLRKEHEMKLHGQEFEVSKERGEELLAIKNASGAVVEIVKEAKESKKAKKEEVEELPIDQTSEEETFTEETEEDE